MNKIKISLFKINIRKLVLLWMWWYLLVTPIVVYWLSFPRFLLYLGDAIGCLISIIVVRDILYKKKTYINIKTQICMLLFLVGGTISALVNMINPIYYVWGIRNCGRFFLFFIAATFYLTIEDFQVTRKLIKVIFWISFPLCIYETYFITYPIGTIIGDMVGGIYHGFAGVSAVLNIILILVSVDVVISFFTNKIKLSVLTITLLAAIIMSALAELKVFIVELAVILLINMLVSKKTLKSILLVTIGLFSLAFMITIFSMINARGRLTYSDIFTVKGFIEYVTRNSGYNGTGDLNRLNGIFALNNGIFNGNLFQHIFGTGLGSGEYTSFFVSKFYNQYSYMHYQWFHMIWIYIENGYLGLITMLGMFFSQFIQAIKIKDVWLKKFVCTILVLFPLLFVYNISLRSEVTGFYLYFILALPCIINKKDKIQKSQKASCIL